MSNVKETSAPRPKNPTAPEMYLPSFPESIDGKISSDDFLTASKELVKILDYFGKIFIPVKRDMLGNIEKLTKRFNTDRKRFSTLQRMLISDRYRKKNHVAIDALLWLRRGLHMIQLFFEFVVNDFESGEDSEDLEPALQKSYRLALQPHHAYLQKQIFKLLIKVIPTRSQIFRAIANGYEVTDEILVKSMDRFSKRLRVNIEALTEFYEENGLESNLD